MNSDDKNKKLASLRNLFEILIQAVFTRQINLQLVAYIATFIQFLQIFSYQHSFHFIENKMILKQIPWYEGYKVVFYVFRPALIFIQFDIRGQELMILIICWLIIMIFILLLIAATLLHDRNQKISQILFTGLINFAAYYNPVFQVIFYEFCSILLVHGQLTFDVIQQELDQLQEQNKTIPQVSVSDNSAVSNVNNYAISAFGGLCLLGHIFLSILTSKYVEQSINVEEKNLSRQESSTIYQIMLINKLLIIAAFTADIHGVSHGLYTVPSLTIIFFCLTLYDFFTKVPFARFKLQNFYLFFASLFGIFSLLSPFWTAFKIISSLEFEVLSILICPILMKLIFVAWIKRRDAIMYQSLLSEKYVYKQEKRWISRKIAMFLMNQKALLVEQSLRIFALYKLHKLQCQSEVYCFCRREGLVNFNDGTRFLLRSQTMNRFIRHWIKLDLENNCQKDIQSNIYQFLRYMDYFRSINKNTYSIQKIIEIITENDKMHKNIGILQESALKIVLHLQKLELKKNIDHQGVSLNLENITLSIKLYIKIAKYKNEIQQDLVSCLQLKIETLEKMKKSFDSTYEVEELNKNLNLMFNQIEKRIVSIYNSMSIFDIQAMVCFFYGEVLGNMKAAWNYSQQHKYSAVNEFIQKKSTFLNVFEEEVVSLTVTVGKQLGKIVGFTEKAPGLLKYDKQEFGYIQNIKELMPITLSRIHDDMLIQMMRANSTSILHDKRQVFLKNKKNFLIRVEVYIDINLIYPEELPFQVFIKPLKQNSGFIFVTQNGQVECMNQEILSRLGYTDIKELPPYYQFDIKLILPEFEYFIESMKVENLEIIEQRNVQFNFFSKKHPIFKQIFGVSKNVESSQGSTISNKNKDEAPSLLKSQLNQKYSQYNKKGQSLSEKNMRKYKIDIIIEKRHPKTSTGGYKYYILEIKNLQKAQESLAQSQKSMFIKDESRLSDEKSVYRNAHEEKNLLDPLSSNHDPFLDIREDNIQKLIINDVQNIEQIQKQLSNQFTNCNSEIEIPLNQGQNKGLQQQLSQSSQHQGSQLRIVTEQKIEYEDEEIEKNKVLKIQLQQNHDQSHQIVSQQSSIMSEIINQKAIDLEDCHSYTNSEVPQEKVENSIIKNQIYTQSGNTKRGSLKNRLDLYIQEPLSPVRQEIVAIDGFINETQLAIFASNSRNKQQVETQKIELQMQLNNYNNLSIEYQQQPNDSFFLNNSNDILILNNLNSGHNNQMAQSNDSRDAATNNQKYNAKSQVGKKGNLASHYNNKDHLQIVSNEQTTYLTVNNSKGIQVKNQNQHLMIDQPDNSFNNIDQNSSISNIIQQQDVNKQQNQRLIQINSENNSLIEKIQPSERKKSDQNTSKKEKVYYPISQELSSSKSSQQFNNMRRLSRKVVNDRPEGSITSSEGSLNKRLDKYSYYEQFIKTSTDPAPIIFIQILKIVLYITYIVAMLITLFMIENNYKDFHKNLDMFDISSLQMHPICNFYILSHGLEETVLQLNYSTVQINQTNHKEIQQIVNIFFLRLQEQFVLYQYNLKENHNNPNLLDYYNQKQLVLFDVFSFNQSKTVTMTLHMYSVAAQSMMNQIAKWSKEEFEQKFLSSFCIDFFRINIVSVTTFFSNLSSEIEEYINTNSQDLINFLTINTVILNIAIFAICLVNIMNYFYYIRILKSIFSLITTTTVQAIEREMIRSKKTLEIVKDSQHYMCRYYFDIKKKEHDIQQDELIKLNNSYQNQGSKHKKEFINIQNTHLPFWRFFVILLIVQFFFIVYSIITCIYNQQFLRDLQPAIIYFKEVNDAIINMPSIKTLEQLITHYQLDPSSIGNQNIEEIQSLYDTKQKQILTFIDRLQKFEDIKLFSNELKQLLKESINSDICQQYDDKLWTCQTISNGVLKKGIINSMTFWYNHFTNLKEINFNQNLLSDDQDLSYISILSIKALNSLRNSIQKEINDLASYQQQNQIIYFIVFLVLLILPFFQDLLIEINNDKERFKLAKQLIFILPTSTIMIEETFFKLLQATQKKMMNINK